MIVLSQISAGDASGLAIGDKVNVSPTNIMYGSRAGPLATDIVKKWTRWPSEPFGRSKII